MDPGSANAGNENQLANYLLCNTAKATDENLTSENWEYIMDVCDKVSTEDSGAKDVVASMIKRLAHRNANVQLYTLEVGNNISTPTNLLPLILLSLPML